MSLHGRIRGDWQINPYAIEKINIKPPHLSLFVKNQPKIPLRADSHG